MIERLGWTLLHFLWQGTAIAVTYAVLRALIGRSLSARGRYALACSALIAMTLAPPLTFLLIAHDADGLPVIVWSLPVAVWQRLLPAFVAVWLAGVTGFSIRLFGGWRFTARLRSASYPAPAEWQRTLEDLAQRVRTSRPVRLLVSSLVEVPTVIGWLRPAILLPVSALTGLPLEHVQALLAHELAHIRRNDYLANILQGVAEAVLFYHPAVWWVSGQIRAERELCCDDLAVAVSGDVLLYAHALAQLESIQPVRVRLGLAQAANGGSLVNRVRRLIDPAQASAESLPGAGAAWAMTLLLVAGAGVATIRAAETPLPALVHTNPAVPADVIRAAAQRSSFHAQLEQAKKLATRARATLLFDPILPTPPSVQLTAPVLAQRIETPEPIISAPVLMARTELPAPNPLPAPTLRAEARMVQIEVSVRDVHGNPVAGLTKDDFMVTDDGKPRTVQIFANPSPPQAALAMTNIVKAGLHLPPTLFTNRNSVPPPPGHSTAIVVDHTGGGLDGLRWSRQSVLALAKKGRPDERIALYVVDQPEGLVLVQDYTTDRDLLLKSMREYSPRFLAASPEDIPRDAAPPVSGAAFTLFSQLNQPAERPSPQVLYGKDIRNTVSSLARPDEQAYEDTVEDLRLSMRDLAEHLALVPGRKSVFWASDGFCPRDMSGMRWNESPAWRQTIMALNEADVAVNVIDTSDSRGFAGDNNRVVMRQIADETGGRLWPARSDAALAEGIEDSRATYTLGFYLTEEERDDRFHTLRVGAKRGAVNQASLSLAYRQGYYAGSSDMPDPASEKGRAAQGLMTALLNQVDSRGVGITARVEVTPGDRHGTAEFGINLDPGTLSLKPGNSAWTGKVEEMLVELNERGRTLAKVSDVRTFEMSDAQRTSYSTNGVTWHLASLLVEGATKIVLAVRDMNSGRMGSLSVPIE